MIADEIFNVHAIVVSVETEKPLNLESWMIDNNFFQVKTISNEVKEQPLVLETWMTDVDFWETSPSLSSL